MVTRWLVFAFLPVIPLGSYRVLENLHTGDKPTIIAKIPLQWDQVFQGWRVTALVLLAFVIGTTTLIWWVSAHP